MKEEHSKLTIAINPKLLRCVQLFLMAITAFLLVGHVLK